MTEICGQNCSLAGGCQLVVLLGKHGQSGSKSEWNTGVGGNNLNKAKLVF